MTEKTPCLKKQFLDAVNSGRLGVVDDTGTIIKLSDFKSYFQNEIITDYINSFLPAATIETGQCSCSHTKYLFRVRKGVYRVHPEALR